MLACAQPADRPFLPVASGRFDRAALGVKDMGAVAFEAGFCGVRSCRERRELTRPALGAC